MKAAGSAHAARRACRSPRSAPWNSTTHRHAMSLRRHTTSRPGSRGSTNRRCWTDPWRVMAANQRRTKAGHAVRAVSPPRAGPPRMPGLERLTGIEPALSAWEAEVLPLNYSRVAPRGDRHHSSKSVRSEANATRQPWGSSPVTPSASSRSRSMWPRCRAVSSTRCSRIHRNENPLRDDTTSRDGMPATTVSHRRLSAA